MTNQNVQTNRHGPQNKGCNQASADSKHYNEFCRCVECRYKDS